MCCFLLRFLDDDSSEAALLESRMEIKRCENGYTVAP